jgi:hypothetical protein
MARTLWRKIITVGATVALTAASLLGVVTWRRYQDAKWCQNATTAASAAAGTDGPSVSDLLHQERSACADQRRRQRAFFGAVWRSGGPEMAACGFEWARVQMLGEQDPAAAAAILASYGITDLPNFDTSSGDNESGFIQVCLSKGHHQSG